MNRDHLKTHLGQRGTSESEEVNPLNVAVKATDVNKLLELFVRQRKTVPFGLDRRHWRQHLRAQLDTTTEHIKPPIYFNCRRVE